MKDTFKQHPRLISFFQTVDGVKFFRESDAKNHARGLEDRTIEEVKRGASKIAEKKTSKKPANPKATEAVKKLTPMQEAKNRIAAIEKLETVEAVEKALEKETAESVKEAGAKRIEAIKTAADSSDKKE